MSNPDETAINLARDFFFSVGLGRISMQSMLADSELEKITLQKRLELFKLTLKDKEVFEKLLSSPQARQSFVNDCYKDLPLSDQFTKEANRGFISDLFRDTAYPSKALLVSNRILKILNNTIDGLPEDAAEHLFFSMCRTYLTGQEVISEEEVKTAAKSAAFCFNGSYHYDPNIRILIANCSEQLMAIRQRANEEYEADRDARIIPEPFSSDRLAALKINL
ncbi:MAG TPA: hypothetical protein DEA55_08940 [Rhodospirillaceae bacterium]|nr:hypothetical protein [Rhodospirillaceae bacterium]